MRAAKRAHVASPATEVEKKSDVAEMQSGVAAARDGEGASGAAQADDALGSASRPSTAQLRSLISEKERLSMRYEGRLQARSQ